MTERDQDTPRDREELLKEDPISESKPSIPFYRRRRFQALALTLAVGVATLMAGKHSADNWNEKLDGYKENTVTLIDKQRRTDQTKCLGSTLLLSSGVVYRATPNSEDFNSKIPGAKLFDDSNKVGIVQPNEELQVKLPKLSLDDGGNQWISFRLVDNPESLNTKKTGPDKNPTQVAAETVWVNYGHLQDKFNAEEEPYITEKPLAGAPALPTDLVDCEIMDDGRTTVNGSPAAYGKIYFDDHFKEVTDFMKFPKAA